MGTISVSLPSDGQTIDVADYNVPINTIVAAINGNLDSNNIAVGGVASTNLATGIQVAGKESNPYKFSVYRTAVQNVGTAATKVAYDTESFDTNNNFDSTTNNRYVAPVNGFYFFTAIVSANTAGTGTSLSVQLYKNGSVILNGDSEEAAAGTAPRANVTGLIQLTAADYVEVFAGTGTAARALDVSGPTTNVFSGFLVSAT